MSLIFRGVIFSVELFLYNNNIPRLYPSLRWGSHAKGILTIFNELTIEMMNSVGPVMAS